jgi:hypothetical protein
VGAMVKKFGGLTLDDWFDCCLVLNVLPYEVYLEHSKEEQAWLVLNYWMGSKLRSWGWSWGSWLSSVVFEGNEYYEDLSYEEKKELDEALLNYIKELAEKVEKDEEKVKKLEKKLRKILYKD